ncbi:MAG: hypothetical protein A2X94_14625 [Bdellovibrionales bacterium GWB1_55_8]|nr:MAG: hypothetical protein A2X94_14625 [Bdellovibrionales bacterium GWB1_55_8]
MLSPLGNLVKAVQTGATPLACSRFFSRFTSVAFLATLLTVGSSCSLTATRPVQLMSDTASALRAAREVQAETLAPELYRQATEWFTRAKQEYKFKGFKMAVKYARKARTFAEQAEFQAVRNGGKQTEAPAPPDIAPQPQASHAQEQPYPYPSPTGTPASEYDERLQQERSRPQPPSPPEGGGPKSPAQLGELPTF